MYSGIPIVIQFDNVIVNTNETLLKLYNYRYHTQLDYTTWTHPNPVAIFGEEIGSRMFNMLEGYTFYDCVTFYKGIIDSIGRLIHMGFDIYIWLTPPNTSVYHAQVELLNTIPDIDKITLCTDNIVQYLSSAICITSDAAYIKSISCRLPILYKQPWCKDYKGITYYHHDDLVNIIFKNLKIKG